MRYFELAERIQSRSIGFNFTFLVMFMISITFCSGVMAAKFGKISDKEWAQSAPADYPEANAIVLFDVADMNVTKKEIFINRHVRIKILNTGGVDEVGEQMIKYYEKYDKIKNLKAHTITSDGKKNKVKKDAIFTKSAGKWRNMTFTFPQLEAGCIVEFKYVVVSKRYFYLTPWYFQSNIYTIKSEYKVTLESGFNYDVTYQNIPRPLREPKIEERHDVRSQQKRKIQTYVWTMTNLLPIKDEPYMSAKENYLSALKFRITLFENAYVYFDYRQKWPELGKETQQRIDEYNNKKPELKKIAEDLTKNLASSRDKAEAIYDYVVNNYQSVKEYNYWYMSAEKIDRVVFL